MNLNEEISNFKSMVNSYKLTSLIIAAKNIGIFECLDENAKDLNQIAEEIAISADRVGPILNGLAFSGVISKNEHGYFE